MADVAKLAERLPPDRLARDQRQPAGAARDPRARAGRHARSSSTGRTRWRGRSPRAARGRSAWSDSTPPSTARPRALRHQPRRARGGLLHQHGQHADARPGLDPRGRRAAARAGRRGHPRHRTADGRRACGASNCRIICPSSPSQAGPNDGIPLVSGDPEAGAIGQPSICSGSATARCATSPAPRTGSRRVSASPAGSEPCVRPGSSRRRRSTATGARSRATSSASELAADPRRHRCLRRERPHGARPAPRAAARPGAPFPAMSASSASTTYRRPRSSHRRSRRCDRTSRARPPGFHLLLDEIERGRRGHRRGSRWPRADRPREHRAQTC